MSRHESLELKKRGTNISEWKFFNRLNAAKRRIEDSNDSIRFDCFDRGSSVIRFTEVCVENIRPRPPQIMRFRDAIHHSGRKPINRDLIPYRESLFDPFRLFFHQTSPSVYPFSTLFVLSLSLSFSLRPIAENRIELLSVDDQFSVGEFSYKRYKEFRIRFFRNCRFGECNACLDTSMDVRLEDCNSKWLKIWLIYQRRGSTRIIF